MGHTRRLAVMEHWRKKVKPPLKARLPRPTGILAIKVPQEEVLLYSKGRTKEVKRFLKSTFVIKKLQIALNPLSRIFQS